MLALLLAATTVVQLSDWPREATELVERYGPPQSFDKSRLVWKLEDRTLEYDKLPKGGHLVIETKPARLSEKKAAELEGPGVTYDPRAKVIRRWGSSEEELR